MVYYVLTKKDLMDQLLNSNELKRLLSETPKFVPALE